MADLLHFELPKSETYYIDQLSPLQIDSDEKKKN